VIIQKDAVLVKPTLAFICLSHHSVNTVAQAHFERLKGGVEAFRDPSVQGVEFDCALSIASSPSQIALETF
jgi:hypothetical protein